jgi:DNA-3-methyladenine glycosylase II
MSCATIIVKPVPPFRLDLTVWALRRRAENIIDQWNGSTYSRVLVLDGKAVELEVSQLGTHTRPRLQIIATGSRLTRRKMRAVSALVERILGTRIDLTGFYRLAARQPVLGDLVRRFRGLKPPRFPTVFESLLTAFACQQVSLAVGVLLLNRLAKTYGVAVEEIGGRTWAFPRPEDLSAEKSEALGRLGFSRQKARAIIELSLAVKEHRLDLEKFTELEGEMLLKQLHALRGVGRWSAEYVSLRGLGRLQVFPGDDVGAQNKLQRYLGLRKAPNYEAVRGKLAEWGDYAGLIYFHLLLHGLAEKGYLS